MSRSILQERRLKAGLTQAELASKANISLDTLRLYEHKTRKIESANIRTLLALSNVLGIPFYCLFDDLSLRQCTADNIASFVEV